MYFRFALQYFYHQTLHIHTYTNIEKKVHVTKLKMVDFFFILITFICLYRLDQAFHLIIFYLRIKFNKQKQKLGHLKSILVDID